MLKILKYFGEVLELKSQDDYVFEVTFKSKVDLNKQDDM